MRRLLAPPALAVALLVAPACGGDDDPSGEDVLAAIEDDLESDVAKAIFDGAYVELQAELQANDGDRDELSPVSAFLDELIAESEAAQEADIDPVSTPIQRVRELGDEYLLLVNEAVDDEALAPRFEAALEVLREQIDAAAEEAEEDDE